MYAKVKADLGRAAISGVFFDAYLPAKWLDAKFEAFWMPPELEQSEGYDMIIVTPDGQYVYQVDSREYDFFSGNDEPVSSEGARTSPPPGFWCAPSLGLHSIGGIHHVSQND